MTNFQAFLLGLVQGLAEFLPVSSSGHTTLLQMLFGIGEAPEMVRNLMEIRGIGIIDVATMFGIGSVMRSKSIDMIVHLEHWVKGKEYDRLGLDDKTHEILGVQVPWLLLPIRPGRNVAVVLEVAARNLMLKQQGYSAAKELEKRMIARMEKSAARAEQAVDAEQL